MRYSVWLFVASAIILSTNVETAFGQDTLYADAYPNGIISNNYEERGLDYRVYPVGNPKYRIKFPRKELQRIVKSTGEVYLNPRYDEDFFMKSGDKKYGMVVLPTVPETGKIYIEDVIHNSTASKEELYSTLLELSSSITYKGGSYASFWNNYSVPESIVQFRLLSESPNTKDYLNYEATWNARYAGDDARIVGTLKLYFKEGRVKYVFSDFFVFMGVKKKGFGFESAQTNNQDQLEYYYPLGRGDVKKFWMPTYYSINYVIDLVEYNVQHPKKTKKTDIEDDW
jgi:hypothetical protein